MIVQAALLLAVWVHLWAQHSTCLRYVFPIVLMSSGFAGLGLLRLSAMVGPWVGQWMGRWKGTVALSLGQDRDNPRPRRHGILRASPAVVVGAISLATAFAWNSGPRTAKVELGRWIRNQAGPSPVLFGPDGFTQVVNYYAQGRCDSFSPTADKETVMLLLKQCRPNIVLLPRDEAAFERVEYLVRFLEGAGFQPLDQARLPASCAHVLVLIEGRPRGLAWKPPGNSGKTE